MTRLSLAPRHDPYWDMDGKRARRQRAKQRLVRYVAWIVLLAVFAIAAANLPAVDPEYLLRGEGRPLMAGALLTLLGAAALLALARIRRSSHG